MTYDSRPFTTLYALQFEVAYSERLSLVAAVAQSYRYSRAAYLATSLRLPT